MLLLAASAFAWDPPRIYVGAHIPINSFAFTSQGSVLVGLDMVPLAVEYRLSPRWGLRLSGDAPIVLGTRALQELGVTMRLEAPAYLGDRAPQDGMRGFYIGPYMAADLYTTTGVGGGAVLGISSKVGQKVWLRTGGNIGGIYNLDTRLPRLDFTFMALEVGGFVY
jgi:hypothetical protein